MPALRAISSELERELEACLKPEEREALLRMLKVLTQRAEGI
jgi:hypothetical protein